MSNESNLINKITTTDILRLMEKLGVPESSATYGNDCVIFPTI